MSLKVSAELPSTIEFSNEREGTEKKLPVAIPPPEPAELPVIVVLTKLAPPATPPPEKLAELPEIVLFTTVSGVLIPRIPPPLFAETLSVIKLLDINVGVELRLMAPLDMPSFAAKTLFVIVSELVLMLTKEETSRAPAVPELLVKEEFSITVVELRVLTAALGWT